MPPETADRGCDLCGLPVGNAPLALRTSEGPKQFCCDGCLGIFSLINEDLIVNTSGGE